MQSGIKHYGFNCTFKIAVFFEISSTFFLLHLLCRHFVDTRLLLRSRGISIPKYIRASRVYLDLKQLSEWTVTPNLNWLSTCTARRVNSLDKLFCQLVAVTTRHCKPINRTGCQRGEKKKPCVNPIV